MSASFLFSLEELAVLISVLSIVQAAYLTEYLHAISSDNFRATLLSLLVSQLLGFGSICISAFQQLSLREVQFDTLSHLLYSRISSFHPFSADVCSTRSVDDRYKDPFSGISFALQWPRKAVNTMTSFMSKDIENVYFDKIIEFSGFKERVERSFTTILLQLERRRVARLTDLSSAIMEEPLVHFEMAKSDNRDFYSVPSFENSAAKPLEKVIFPGPRPGVSSYQSRSPPDALATTNCVFRLIGSHSGQETTCCKLSP